MSRNNQCRIVERDETYPVRGEPITIRARVRVDARDRDIFDEELDSASLLRAYDAYRTRHGIVSPAELIAIRERYGLSQSAFSLVLGFGAITMHRYENGSLPTASHNQIIRSCNDAACMRHMLDTHGHRLPTSVRRKLAEALGTTVVDPVQGAFERILSRAPGELNGYRPFSFARFREAAVALSQHVGVWKTKLNKLLFYADFLSFAESSVSITGACYVREKLGPVPQRYESLFDALVASGDLACTQKDYPNGTVGTLYKATRAPDKAVLSDEDRDTVQRVLKRFGRMTCAAIKEFSHKERAWSNTPPDQLISYDFADSLSVCNVATAAQD